jgi:hypothetical protein
MTQNRLELPALPYEEWAPTKKTLQMCAQMMGKARIALSPTQPEWLHTALHLDARGLTTGLMPHDADQVSMGIDVYDSTMWVRVSDGRSAAVGIGGGRCVAEIWNDVCVALSGLGIPLDVWEKPQEIADVTLFSQNTHDCTLDPAHAQRFYRVLAALGGVFDEFRSTFFGRTGVQFWWGAFDLAVLLFNGKKAVAPDDLGYIMRYDLDAEHMNAGFWPGDDNAPHPGFYAYLVPRPDGCEVAPIEPAHAGWVESMGEWMMPYDKVRETDDPRKAILDFLRSVYQVAITNGGWDAEEFRYTRPPVSTRS